MAFEFFIGRRYLKAKKKEAFISLITLLSTAGVTLGVMALIVVIAVMSGAEADLQSRILMIQPHITLMRYGGQFSDYPSLRQQILQDEDVLSVAPYVYSQAMLRSAAGISGALIKGIDPNASRLQIKGYDKSHLEVPAAGRPASVSANAPPPIVIGARLAEKLKVDRDDVVYLILPQSAQTRTTRLPKMQRFRVTGFFETGFHDYDQTFAFIHLGDAQQMLNMRDAVSGLEIKIKDLFQAQEHAVKLADSLGFPYWARDWMSANRNIFLSLKQQKVVMYVILSLIVLVAAFSIASTLIMTVIEKTRDIAILKAMGASRRSIRKIFVFNGMVIGMIGTVLGMIAGFILCAILQRYKFIDLPGDVYYFTSLPIKLEPLDILIISTAALILCWLATLYPAHQASRLPPVEGIRTG